MSNYPNNNRSNRQNNRVRNQHRILLKSQILAAQEKANSARHTARLLNVDMKTYVKYATLYGIYNPNYSGKGVTRFRSKRAAPLRDIFEGKHPKYDRTKLMYRLMESGLKPVECDLCGFKECRPDRKFPMRLHYKDGDEQNLALENLEFRCFNCIFLTESGTITNHALTDRRGTRYREEMSGTIYENDWAEINEEEMLPMDDDEIENLRDSILDEIGDE